MLKISVSFFIFGVWVCLMLPMDPAAPVVSGPNVCVCVCASAAARDAVVQRQKATSVTLRRVVAEPSPAQLQQPSADCVPRPTRRHDDDDDDELGTDAVHDQPAGATLSHRSQQTGHLRSVVVVQAAAV